MVTLSDSHLQQLNMLVGEMPFKFALPIVNFLNVIIAEQQQQTQDQKSAAEGSHSDTGGGEVGGQNGSGAERGVAGAHGTGI